MDVDVGVFIANQIVERCHALDRVLLRNGRPVMNRDLKDLTKRTSFQLQLRQRITDVENVSDAVKLKRCQKSICRKPALPNIFRDLIQRNTCLLR